MNIENNVNGVRLGVKNYNSTKLLGVIEKVLPGCEEEWKRVGLLYKIESGEDTIRDWKALKRCFLNKLCDNLKRPTGLSAPNELTTKARMLSEKIKRKLSCGILGDEDGDPDDEEEDNLMDGNEDGNEDVQDLRKKRSMDDIEESAERKRRIPSFLRCPIIEGQPRKHWVI